MSEPDKRRPLEAGHSSADGRPVSQNPQVAASDAHDRSLSASTSLDDLFKAILGDEAPGGTASAERANAATDRTNRTGTAVPLARERKGGSGEREGTPSPATKAEAATPAVAAPTVAATSVSPAPSRVDAAQASAATHAQVHASLLDAPVQQRSRVPMMAVLGVGAAVILVVGLFTVSRRADAPTAAPTSSTGTQTAPGVQETGASAAEPAASTPPASAPSAQAEPAPATGAVVPPAGPAASAPTAPVPPSAQTERASERERVSNSAAPPAARVTTPPTTSNAAPPATAQRVTTPATAPSNATPVAARPATPPATVAPASTSTSPAPVPAAAPAPTPTALVTSPTPAAAAPSGAAASPANSAARDVPAPAPAPAATSSSTASPATAGTSATTPASQAAPAATQAPTANQAPAAPVATEPVLVSSVRPVYPEYARRAGSLGDVELDVTIDASGRVSRAVAVSGPAVLRAAAVSAVLQWRYQPATTGGTPVVSRRRVRVSFQ